MAVKGWLLVLLAIQLGRSAHRSIMTLLNFRKGGEGVIIELYRRDGGYRLTADFVFEQVCWRCLTRLQWPF